jgi:hypothetical protein
MISKQTDARKIMKYIIQTHTHTVYLLHVSATHVAILREVYYKGQIHRNFTFMLPCIAIDFFLNNQLDALIIPILFCYKTLHVSGIFSAHHQEFSTVRSALVTGTS